MRENAPARFKQIVFPWRGHSMPPDYANILQSGEAAGKGLDGNRKDRGRSDRVPSFYGVPEVQLFVAMY
jgi:hypothetical protein